MKERIHEIRLTEQDSIPIEQTQTRFMSEALELAIRSGLLGHGVRDHVAERGRV